MQLLDLSSFMLYKFTYIQTSKDFPDSPVVKLLPCNARGVVGSIPGQEAKIAHALGPKNQNIKQKRYCNKFNKDLKKEKPSIHKHTHTHALSTDTLVVVELLSRV